MKLRSQLRASGFLQQAFEFCRHGRVLRALELFGAQIGETLELGPVGHRNREPRARVIQQPDRDASAADVMAVSDRLVEQLDRAAVLSAARESDRGRGIEVGVAGAELLRIATLEIGSSAVARFVIATERGQDVHVRGRDAGEVQAATRLNQLDRLLERHERTLRITLQLALVTATEQQHGVPAGVLARHDGEIVDRALDPEEVSESRMREQLTAGAERRRRAFDTQLQAMELRATQAPARLRYV